ncbi:MAG: YceI family protein, partial [Verrucomicrobiota bacterium]|nr:YceI family protein [Verrucomicrobiota bacterium]
RKYPEGKCVITAAEPIADVSQGRPNYRIRGALTLKGIERGLDFPALIAMPSTGSKMAQANFDIDRTEWNVIYGSGRFFENLGKHLVNDLVSIQLKIVVE